jgi:predicted choloylglycine hydrolase
VKHADKLVLLAKEKTVLQGMTDGVIESGMCCGMETRGRKLR